MEDAVDAPATDALSICVLCDGKQFPSLIVCLQPLNECEATMNEYVRGEEEE